MDNVHVETHAQEYIKFKNSILVEMGGMLVSVCKSTMSWEVDFAIKTADFEFSERTPF